MADHPGPDLIQLLRDDNSPAIQAFSDQHGQPVVINKALRRFVADGALASWQCLFDPQDHDRWQELMLLARREQNPVSDTFRLRRFDQAVRTFVLRAQPHYDVGGEFSGHIVSGMDVTGLNVPAAPSSNALDKSPNYQLEDVRRASASEWHRQLVSVSTVITGCIETIPDLLPSDVSPQLQIVLSRLFQANSLLRKTVSELSTSARSVD
jgi:hypothetical protein